VVCAPRRVDESLPPILIQLSIVFLLYTPVTSFPPVLNRGPGQLAICECLQIAECDVQDTRNLERFRLISPLRLSANALKPPRALGQTGNAVLLLETQVTSVRSLSCLSEQLRVLE
jgi:hypothetical protein